MDRVVLALLTIVLVSLVAHNLHLAWLCRTRGREAKLGLFAAERSHVLCVAGEAHKDSWSRIHDLLLANPALACDVICGPLDQIEKSFFEDAQGPLNLRERRLELRMKHPIFRLLRDKPAGTYRLFVRRQAFPRERHYAIGCQSRRMFLEWHHGEGPFRGGMLIRDADFIREKKQEHELLRSQPDLCRQITLRDCESNAFFEDPDFPFSPARPQEQKLLAACGGR